MKVLRAEEVSKAVGIRRVLELISGKHLPLVGFEMLNDLMFSYHWCVDRLPEKCQSFVTSMAQDFPLVVDVKVGDGGCDESQSVCRVKSLSDFLPESQSLESIYKEVVLRMWSDE